MNTENILEVKLPVGVKMLTILAEALGEEYGQEAIRMKQTGEHLVFFLKEVKEVQS